LNFRTLGGLGVPPVVRKFLTPRVSRSADVPAKARFRTENAGSYNKRRRLFLFLPRFPGWESANSLVLVEVRRPARLTRTYKANLQHLGPRQAGPG
jgi:hypothetical protein